MYGQLFQSVAFASPANRLGAPALKLLPVLALWRLRSCRPGSLVLRRRWLPLLGSPDLSRPRGAGGCLV